jgi:hypothetical protein
MGSAMAYRDLWLTESPLLSGVRFSYPFAANFISAVLIRLGVPFFQAFIIPSFLGSCAIVVALFYFFRTLFRSAKVAVISSMVFLLNGGLGFVYLIQDVLNSSSPLYTLLNPLHEYTRLDSEHIKWISVVDSMILPQRAFTHGFPLALLGLTLVLKYFFGLPSAPKNKKMLVIAGLIFGVLPIVHTHSFLAVAIILGGWSLGDLYSHAWKKDRLLDWLLLLFATGIISIPLYLYYFSGQVTSFLTFYPGWLAKEYKESWLIFWFKNWSITPIIAGLGFFVFLQRSTPKKKVINAGLMAPFFFLFALINVFLFQPFSWDNTKLLVWASLGMSGLAGWLLVTKWRSSQTWKRGLIILVFFFMTASGGYDLYWDIRTDLHSYTHFTAEELSLADWVKMNTPADGVWLTGDKHNHWLFNLTGRQPVMAYRGWLWTYGYDYKQREKDVERMFLDPSRTDIYDQYQIQFVVVGPDEVNRWQADHKAFETTMTLIKKTDNYYLFSR